VVFGANESTVLKFKLVELGFFSRHVGHLEKVHD